MGGGGSIDEPPSSNTTDAVDVGAHCSGTTASPAQACDNWGLSPRAIGSPIGMAHHPLDDIRLHPDPARRELRDRRREIPVVADDCVNAPSFGRVRRLQGSRRR